MGGLEAVHQLGECMLGIASIACTQSMRYLSSAT